LISHEGLSRGSEGLPDVVLTCGRTFARGYQLQQPSAQRHRGLTADGLAIRADGSSQVSGIGKIGPWPRSADNGRDVPAGDANVRHRRHPAKTGHLESDLAYAYGPPVAKP
jgi:hypothetical protein